MTTTPQTAPDISRWPTKTEVMALLSCSPRSVERLTERGELEMRLRPRPGKAAIGVYNPAHVESAKGKLAKPAAVLPVQAQVNAPAVVRENRITELPAEFAGLPAHLAALSFFARELAEKYAAPVYVSIKDAVRLTGLSAQSIRDLATSGAVKTMPYGRGVRYRRADLEAL